MSERLEELDGGGDCEERYQPAAPAPPRRGAQHFRGREDEAAARRGGEQRKQRDGEGYERDCGDIPDVFSEPRVRGGLYRRQRACQHGCGEEQKHGVI